MAQNIYDEATFFAGYSRLPRSVEGLDGAPEWTALRALLPDVAGRSVLDLGCGFGWFCRWAEKQGAARVMGIDLSERMLARARAESDASTVTYLRSDLETVVLPKAGFDLVYSSLVFHYIADLKALLAKVHAALAPGGGLIFSVEHPMFTAPACPGWSATASGRATWPVDSYLDEGPRRTDWLTKGVLKQHRTMATYINLLLGTGFVLSDVIEWGPSEEQIAAHPDWANERQRPPFLLMGCRR